MNIKTFTKIYNGELVRKSFSNWNKVGDLPTERQDCACCLLPSGEILVAGGDSSASRMDVAAVKD